MQQIKNFWVTLDKRKQLMVVAAITAMFVSVATLSKMASSPTLTLLYAGLEGQTAGDTVQALEGLNVPFEVRGGSIFVPANQRDELRMMLAAEGLPATGTRGYELLDSLSGFGTTSQMFDAAYWRAKEGELARTITASPFVSQARVHIANSGSNPFRKSSEVTASVSVVPSGAPITQVQANALRYLIALAVAGLTVDNVAIIDANGTLLASADSAAGSNTAEDQAQVLRERVLNLVEARVGQRNAVVEISVETITETETIRERRFDPDNRVAISTDIEEQDDSSTNQSGDVTVASNLPDGDASFGEESQAKNSSTRERINYEVSHTDVELLRVPGAIKRLTVAVLVNGLPAADTAVDAVFEPRSQEELAALKELVSAAVGFDAKRGDVITLKSMDLLTIEPLGTAASSSSFLQSQQLDVMSLIQIAALALVTLILGVFVVRPILANAQESSLPEPTTTLSLPPLEPGGAIDPIHIGEIDDGEKNGSFSPALGSPFSGQIGALPGIGTMGDNAADPVDRLRALIGERQEETVEILRGWLEESEEST